MTESEPMSSISAEFSWLESAIAPLSQLRVAVWGDFCLDVYWLRDTERIEVSIQTGFPGLRVYEQRHSLCGEGNVVPNLSDLGVGILQAIGVIGTDLFGRKLLELMLERGADT